MAAPRIFHPCAFDFLTTNIRRINNVLDGGTSLSGFADKNEASGGGFLAADFSDGAADDKAAGNAWRAITDSDGGEPFLVLLCAERLYQPVGAVLRAPHDHASPFNLDPLSHNPGASFTVAAAAPLRATSLTIVGLSELALIGGELFSIQHPTWGWRAYRIRSVTQAGTNTFVITFRTPLREAVTAGTAVELDTPRCQMVFAQAAGNQTDIGRYTSCAVSFIEDMRPPA